MLMVFIRNLLFALLLLFAVNTRTAAQAHADTSEPYKISAKHLINLKLDFHSNNEWFEVTQPGPDFDIRPNVAVSNKLSFNYKFLSVGYSYVPKIYPGNNDDELKGNTRASGLSFSFSFDKWLHDVRLGKIQGLYLHNTADHVPGFMEGQTPYAQLPNLKIASFRGASRYKFNPNYSLKAVRSQTEIQLKSAGSVLAGLVYSYYDIRNQSPDTSLIISQKSQSVEIAATAGYYYTLVINKHWYGALGVTPGWGINYAYAETNVNNETIPSENALGVVRLTVGLGVGYNAEHLFFGGEVEAYKTSRRVNDSLIALATYNAYVQVFVGYRFHAPKEVDEAVKKWW
jgi:hypothetical protein